MSGKAIETADHLLWAALIETAKRRGGTVFSRANSQEGNALRAVYEVCGFDPRGGECFREILEQFQELVSADLPISTAAPVFSYKEALDLCSEESYRVFLEQLRYKTGDIRWGLVVVGNRKAKHYICCPCVHQHLERTSQLKDFEYEISLPKRVGRDRYEFRIRVF